MSSGLYARLAWGFALGFVLLHIGNGVFHAHDTLVQQSANYAMAQINRVRLVDELTAADPGMLQRLSSDDFRVAGANTAPTQPSKSWRHRDEVHRLVAPHLRKLGLTDTQARYWFRFERGGPRLELAIQRGHANTKALAAGEP